MSQAHTLPETDRPRATQPLAWVVLVAAVLQVVAPVVTINGPGTSPGGGAGADLLITPVGWAFSIWGVIYALALAQAVATLIRRTATLPRRLQVDQIVLYLGGALWIAMAALDSSLATAAALLIMFAAAADAVFTLARAGIAPRWFSTLTRLAVGLYAGWVTAAFFLNLSTALVAADVVDAAELGWQLAMLCIAAVVLLGITVAARAYLPYAAAGCWALAGIAVTGISDGTTSVTVVAIAAGVVLAGTALAQTTAAHRS